MMGSIHGVRETCVVGIEDRRDHREIRKMGTAEPGVIDDGDVARMQFQSRPHRSHAVAEGSKVHRHMGCVDDQSAIRVDNPTGVIETFLHVHAEGRSAERLSHIQGD